MKIIGNGGSNGKKEKVLNKEETKEMKEDRKEG
jgi:hypothetical protein